MSNTPEVIDDISTLAIVLNANDWFAMLQLYKGILWARLRVRTEPLQHLSQRLHFAEFKRILAFVPWFHSTKGP